MYIQSAEIAKIRSTNKFKLEFKDPAGWHVLIGDNGAGKSSILKSLSLVLIGPEQVLGLRSNWNDWMMKDENEASIKMNITVHQISDINVKAVGNNPLELNFYKDDIGNTQLNYKGVNKYNIKGEIEIKKGSDGFWAGNTIGWFSAGFGPFRRFTGGSGEWESVFKNPQLSRLSSHLTLFDESAALTETTEWLKKLKFQELEGKSNQLNTIKELINSSDFLPHKAKLNEIGSDGVTFLDGNGVVISMNQLSDGFRSILSLTFELLRQIIRSYGEQGNIFSYTPDGEVFVNKPGVVLIDEIDAHLHPTWQTRIGQWFIKYFPNMQFIVTTHSPLICRACEKGSIWRLATPGSELQSGEITGTNRNRLIFGNVLDAYGTEVFGENVSQSANGEEMLKELADLTLKSFKGTISENDKKRMQELKKILPTE